MSPPGLWVDVDQYRCRRRHDVLVLGHSRDRIDGTFPLRRELIGLRRYSDRHHLSAARRFAHNLLPCFSTSSSPSTAHPLHGGRSRTASTLHGRATPN